MRVLVTGSRDWPREADVIAALDHCLGKAAGREDLTIVHGDCPNGADAMARRWCEGAAFSSAARVFEERHPAEWDRLGKQAGFIRNLAMVSAGADLVLAFCKDQSRGTMHTVRLAEKAGLRVELFTA